jgi:hypothetical protein
VITGSPNQWPSKTSSPPTALDKSEERQNIATGCGLLFCGPCAAVVLLVCSPILCITGVPGFGKK